MRILSWISLFTLCVLFTISMISACPPGQYSVNQVHRPSCDMCFFGTYCPGDNSSYDCPEGTIAPNEGMSACIKCPSSRTNDDSTTCLLPDTPLNVRSPNGVFDYDNLEFEVSAHLPYWYITISEYNFNKNNSMEFSFYSIPIPTKNVPILVFASISTGMPSKDNYMITASGQNATLLIPSNFIGEYTYFNLYLYIVPLVRGSFKFRAHSNSWFNRVLSLKSNQLYDETLEYLNVQSNQVILTWNDIPQNSKVSLNVTLTSLTSQWETKSFDLCYSSMPEIQYPNSHNSDVVVEADLGHFALLQTVKKNDGVFRVSLIVNYLDKAQLKLKLIHNNQ